jgi:hypothetical protein
LKGNTGKITRRDEPPAAGDYREKRADTSRIPSPTPVARPKDRMTRPRRTAEVAAWLTPCSFAIAVTRSGSSTNLARFFGRQIELAMYQFSLDVLLGSIANGPPLDDVDQEEHDRNHEENVQNSTQCVCRHQPKKPQNQAHDGNEEHTNPLKANLMQSIIRIPNP